MTMPQAFSWIILACLFSVLPCVWAVAKVQLWLRRIDLQERLAKDERKNDL